MSKGKQVYGALSCWFRSAEKWRASLHQSILSIQVNRDSLLPERSRRGGQEEDEEEEKKNEGAQRRGPWVATGPPPGAGCASRLVGFWLLSHLKAVQVLQNQFVAETVLLLNNKKTTTINEHKIKKQQHLLSASCISISSLSFNRCFQPPPHSTRSSIISLEVLLYGSEEAIPFPVLQEKKLCSQDKVNFIFRNTTQQLMITLSSQPKQTKQMKVKLVFPHR